MAKPSMKPSTKGAPPSVETSSPVVGNNTSKPEAGSKVPLNFRVPPEIRREFRGFANDHEMQLQELFLEVWKTFKQAKGKG